LLKGFLKKIRADGAQVVAEEVAEPEALFGLQILFTFEQQPLFQDGRPAFPGHTARFSGADFIESLVHLRHDMETIEDMAISRGESPISGLQSRCAQALDKTVQLAEAASPTDPTIRIKAFLPAWAKRGVVRKVRHSQRQILPGGRYLQHLALMDIDGRLETITSASPSQIECGDWAVVAGRADHEANLFYNESRPPGNKGKRYQAMPWVLAALGTLATLGLTQQ
jgi:hypothetical protein